MEKQRKLIVKQGWGSQDELVYRVLRLTNMTHPVVGDRLSEQELLRLRDGGATVEVQ